MDKASKVRVAVVGATGYTGAELLRLMHGHSGIEVTLDRNVFDSPADGGGFSINAKGLSPVTVRGEGNRFVGKGQGPRNPRNRAPCVTFEAEFKNQRR